MCEIFGSAVFYGVENEMDLMVCDGILIYVQHQQEILVSSAAISFSFLSNPKS